MAIIAVTGIPGSGKSYWMAYQLMLGGQSKKFTTYHNVEGLDGRYFAGHVEDWREMCPQDRAGELFAKKEQIEFDKVKRAQYDDKPLLWILDEAGQYLDKEDDQVYAWLSWHRHLGQDVWIGVQDIRKLHRSYRGLIEIEVRACKSRVVDSFVYSHRVGRTQFRQEKLKKQKAVFQSYRSFDATGNPPKRSMLLPMGIAAGVLSVGLMAYTAWGMTHMFTGGDVGKKTGAATVASSAKAHSKTGEAIKRKKPSAVVGFEQGDYSYAGSIGGRVRVQGKNGALSDLGEHIGPYHVLDASASGATIIYRNHVAHVYRRGGYVAVKDDRRPAAGVGVPGGGSAVGSVGNDNS